ncbi:MAG: hypothetical protein AAF939_16195 [Planctomycetota bacterium]
MISSKRQIKTAAICLLFSLWVGCGRGGDNTEVAERFGHHGGHLIQIPSALGFELEFTLDAARRRIVLFVQQLQTELPFPLAVDHLEAEFESGGRTIPVSFEADPRASDPAGKSSRFVLDLDALPQQMFGSNQYSLTVWFPENGKKIKGSMSHRNDHRHNYKHD